MMRAMLSRRDFFKASAALYAAAVGCSSEPVIGPRNIVLITGDDLGWKDLSSSGNPNVATPNLDRLAAGGVSFTHAFDVTSTCSSSRTTYATGQYPHTHGVVGLVHRIPELSLPEGTPTLASHLRDAGFLTAIEGKWHLAFPQTPEGYGYTEVMTTLLTQWIQDSTVTVEFIQRAAGRRFYYEVNYMNPHRNWFGKFEQHPDHPIDPASVVVPAYAQLPDVAGAREELAAYYSQVERMDTMIGELLAALEAEDLLDDTLIVFISDNGMPFPGNKLNLHDRGTGTPWFFHWPAGLPAGVARDDLVASGDLMPTLLDLVGVPIPAEVQGQSLAPLLVDPATPSDRAAVFAEMTTHEDPDAPFPMRSARTARFRYIRNYDATPVPMEGGDQPWVLDVLAMDLPGYRWTQPRVPEELYDLAADPQEQHDLAGDPTSQDVLADLRARLDAHLIATGDPLAGVAPDFAIVDAAPLG
jgi:N-sulfoglucosamine sulfohydrolase